MPQEYICPICKLDQAAWVTSNEEIFTPEKTMLIHTRLCRMSQKTKLLDTFCKDWGSRLAFSSAPLQQLVEDWRKLDDYQDPELAVPQKGNSWFIVYFGHAECSVHPGYQWEHQGGDIPCEKPCPKCGTKVHPSAWRKVRE